MNSQQFDALTRAAAMISRRSLLRWMGASAVGVFVASIRTRTALTGGRLSNRVSQFGPPLPPLPPAEPWSSENPPNLDDIIDDYLDCITTGRTPEECDQGFPGFAPFDWCQLVWDVLTEAMPTLAGLASTFTPFSRNCGDRDCFQCCYSPRNGGGCGTSYIGFPVINCNTSTYGEGTKPVGLTFIIDPDSIEPGDSCLFIPQLCVHIAQCVKTASASAALGNTARAIQPQQALDKDYLTDPRAIDQRARYFATKVQDEVRTYLESYNTSTPDARPFHSLAEALTNRGRVGWRRDFTNTPIDITNTALRINDLAGNLNESASWANAAQLLGVARVLGGVPNLAARLAYVESRKWTQAEKDAYLAGVGDPVQALSSVLDPHWIAVLKRLLMLQDYALLAVPLAGEATTAGKYGGEMLGKPPTLSLRATTSGAAIMLTLSIVDAEDVAGGLARPVAVDWGDGRVTHHALPSGQPTLDVTHAYEVAGRYIVYAVAANDSGLRGHAALVVEALAVTPALPPTSPTISRIQLSGLTLTNLLSTKKFSLEARLVDAAGQGFRAGRSALGKNGSAVNVPFALGDFYAHNPARFDTALLSLDIRNELTSPHKVFAFSMTMAATMTLSVFSTATQHLVEQPVALTPDMLKLYLAGASTPMPSNTVTVDANGALRFPLFWRAPATLPWQKIVRIDIAITPEMFNSFVLDATPTTVPAGTTAAWVELRPGALTPVLDPVPPTPTPTLPPAPTETPTPTPAESKTKAFLPWVQR